MREKQIYDLDVSAKFFAAIASPKWKPAFRFTAVLTEAADPVVLQLALNNTLQRFPYLNVVLRPGFIWPRFEENTAPVTVKDDCDKPFAPPEAGEPPFRVCYHDKKISVEMQHVLGDGHTAMALLKTLLAQYFGLKGIDVPAINGVFDVHEPVDPAEYEDSHLKFIRRNIFTVRRAADAVDVNEKAVRRSGAYHISGKAASPRNQYIISGVMNVRDVVVKARSLDASVSEYLSSVLAYAIYRIQTEANPKKYLPVKISLAADLRRYYPTKTLRNFVQYSNPGIRPCSSDLSFRTIVAHMRNQCGHLFTEQRLNAIMSRNVAVVRSVGFLPMFIKRPCVLLVHALAGDRMYTMNLSNLGVAELPEEIRDKVERFETTGCNLRSIKLECGAISFNGRLTVAFSSASDDTGVQDRFFEILAAEGIPVRIESNFTTDAAQAPLNAGIRLASDLSNNGP